MAGEGISLSAGVPALESSDEEESIIIDCTKGNFIEQSNDFIKRVNGASFIAIDEEMTGIQLPPSLCDDSGRLSKEASPAERYSSTKKVSERYSIIQLGICLFEEDSTAPEKINVRRYKFTMFPPEDSKITREVILSPSSVKFLSDNNCNLNEWIKEGIPFCTGDMAEHLLDKFLEDEEEKLAKEAKPETIPSFDGRKRVQLRRLEDQQFHARAMSTLREWLDTPSSPSPEDQEGTSLLLPPCNSFMRRALYESISSEYGTLLVLETVRQNNQIKVWRLTPTERVQRNDRLRREGFERLLLEKVGAWRVFLALHLACSGSDVQTRAEHMALSMDVDEAMAPWEPATDKRIGRKVPLIVHNGLQDLLFLMTHFHKNELPETWPECKSLLHSYFPIIYDTKLMATEHCHRDTVRGRTHLGALYELALIAYPRWNRAFTSNGSTELGEQLHDAGFDAYCTGVAFYGLAALNRQQCQYPSSSMSSFALWNCSPSDPNIAWHYGRNKIYFHLSPYTIDLEAATQDPLTRGMSRSSIFRVAGIDSSITTRDIVRSLSGLTDSTEGTVNYELIWVNDICFLVGAMHLSRDDGPHAEHGKIIYQALKARFPNAAVEPFGATKADGDFEPSLWNLWGLLPVGRKRASSDDDFERSMKRRRLE